MINPTLLTLPSETKFCLNIFAASNCGKLGGWNFVYMARGSLHTMFLKENGYLLQLSSYFNKSECCRHYSKIKHNLSHYFLAGIPVNYKELSKN